MGSEQTTGSIPVIKLTIDDIRDELGERVAGIITPSEMQEIARRVRNVILETTYWDALKEATLDVLLSQARQ